MIEGKAGTDKFRLVDSLCSGKGGDYLHSLFAGKLAAGLWKHDDGSCRLQNMTEGYHRSIEKDRDAIKQLIMEIAHQLRTPLTNMENYLDFLKDEEDTQARQKYWDAVSISEKKVRFLTESFIKMSRLENRIIQIDKSDADLKDTLLTQEKQKQIR